MRKDKMIGWHHQLNAHEFESLSKLWEMVKDREAWYAEFNTTEQQPTTYFQLIHRTLFSLEERHAVSLLE